MPYLRKIWLYWWILSQFCFGIFIVYIVPDSYKFLTSIGARN